MSESTTEMTGTMIDPVTGEIIDQKELAERLLAQAKEQGVSLVGPGGLLNQLTRNVLETALEAELTEHLCSLSASQQCSSERTLRSRSELQRPTVCHHTRMLLLIFSNSSGLMVPASRRALALAISSVGLAVATWRMYASASS